MLSDTDLPMGDITNFELYLSAISRKIFRPIKVVNRSLK